MKLIEFSYPSFTKNVRRLGKLCDIKDRQIYLSELTTSYGDRRLDIRIWTDDTPTKAGFFLTFETARKLCDMIEEFLNKSDRKTDPAGQTLAELGFNPWRD